MAPHEQTIRVSSADEEHMRVRLSLDDLKANCERDPALWALADCHARDARCDPSARLTCYGGDIGWVNVTHSDPAQFTFDGQNGPIKGFSIDLGGKTIFSFPSQIHAIGLMLDVLECRNSRTPQYHQIEQTIRGVHRVYRRLLAPFEDSDGRVDRVFYAIRWLIEPVTLVKAPVDLC